MSLPLVSVGHMDMATGAHVDDGDVSTVYLTVCGVRIRVNVHAFGGEPEANIVIDPHWTRENPVNGLDVIEFRAHGSQAAIRVRGN